MPNFNGQGSPSFAQGPKGLADMLASALRGGVKATLGMPGDVERLGRMGINALGGSVDPQAALPTTEDWDKRLPPVNPMTGQSFKQVENLGEFLPLNAAGPIVSAAGKAYSAVQALRQSAPAATSMGRRTALKGLGAAGASAAVAPELVVQALRSIPATTVGGKMAAPIVAEAATKGLSAAGRAALAKAMDGVYEVSSVGVNKLDVPTALRLASKVAGDLPEEKLAEGMERLAGLTGQGRFSRSTVPGDKMLTQNDLDKLGYDDLEKIQEAVFHGKLNPGDIHEDVLFAIGLNRSPGNWTLLTDALQGHDEMPILDMSFKPKELP